MHSLVSPRQLWLMMTMSMIFLFFMFALFLCSGGIALRSMRRTGRITGILPALKLAARDGLDTSAFDVDELRRVASEGGHADGENFLRLFHPAFPMKILEPLSIKAAEEFLNVKRSVSMEGSDMEDVLKSGLPWEVLPKLGINDFEGVWSKNQTEAAYEKYRHTGNVVWAAKTPAVHPNCVLLNHWRQEAIFITEYSPTKGAKGITLVPGSGTVGLEHVWPPAALEIELKEKKWQPVVVSENISNGQILSYLTPDMKKGPWELIFLLLTPSSDTKTLESLLDTGLSPRQGFIAYLRLLEGAMRRTETFDEIPDYRKIKEQHLFL